MPELDLKILFAKYNIRQCDVYLNCLTKKECTVAREKTWSMLYNIKECYVKVTRLRDQDLIKSTRPPVRILQPSTDSVRSHVLWLPINPNYEAPSKNNTRLLRSHQI